MVNTLPGEVLAPGALRGHGAAEGSAGGAPPGRGRHRARRRLPLDLPPLGAGRRQGRLRGARRLQDRAGRHEPGAGGGGAARRARGEVPGEVVGTGEAPLPRLLQIVGQL